MKNKAFNAFIVDVKKRMNLAKKKKLSMISVKISRMNLRAKKRKGI